MAQFYTPAVSNQPALADAEDAIATLTDIRFGGPAAAPKEKDYAHSTPDSRPAAADPYQDQIAPLQDLQFSFDVFRDPAAIGHLPEPSVPVGPVFAVGGQYFASFYPAHPELVSIEYAGNLKLDSESRYCCNVKLVFPNGSVNFSDYPVKEVAADERAEPKAMAA